MYIFDGMLHRMGINPYVIRWVDNHLIELKQRINVVNGESSVASNTIPGMQCTTGVHFRTDLV